MTTSNGSHKFEHTENEGQFDSKCLICGRSIATSPNPEWLTIAEGAHQCREPLLAQLPSRNGEGVPQGPELP